MKRVLATLTLLTGAALLGGNGLAYAQAADSSMAPTTLVPPSDSGTQAGTLMVRLAATGVIPLNSGSKIEGIGGNIGTTAQAMPEVDLSYFFTDSISAELIATATRHALTANNTALTPLLGPKIDLGTTYVLPPAIMLQYHFLPHGLINPYLGAGIDLMWPFDVQPNQFKLGGAQVIQKLGLSNQIGPVFEVGLDYNVAGPWFLNIDYKQIINRVDARVTTVLGLVKADTNLNPGVFSAGVAYRF